MSLFRKPKKPIQRRVFSGYSDEEDSENNVKMDIDDIVITKSSTSHSTSSSSHSRDKKKEKKSSSSSNSKEKSQSLQSKPSLLSFEDEEEGEVFQVKKSSYSKKVMKMLDKERKKKKSKSSSVSSTNDGSNIDDNYHGSNSGFGGGTGSSGGESSRLIDLGKTNDNHHHHDNHFNNLQENDSNNKLNNSRNKSKNSNTIQTEIRTADFVLVVKKSEPELILNGRAALCAGKDDMSSEDEEDAATTKKSQHKFNQPDNFKMVLESGAIPDAAMIHAARKSRQKAREQSDFIPIEEKKIEKKGNRLVRDDPDDCSDDEERIDMSAITGVKEREERKEKFYSAQQEYSGEESDPDMNEWENQQIRKGVTGAQLVTAQQESVFSQFMIQPLITDSSNLTTGALLEQAYAKSSYEKPRQILLSTQHRNENKPTGPRMPNEVLEKLTDRLIQLKELNKNHYIEIDRFITEFKLLKTEEIDCEQKAPIAAGKYRFYQEMRGYVTDLIECLDEKIPLITELEKKAISIMAKRTNDLIERRRQDVRDQAKEIADSLKQSGSRKQNEDEFHIRRAAEREGRRTRRRRDREKNEISDLHLDGMSSDDEIADIEVTQYKSQLEQIKLDANIIFEDASSEFSEINEILNKFDTWKKYEIDSYKDAYVTLCLPKIIGPLIRLEMIIYSPFDENLLDIEKMYWYNTTMLYGLNSNDTELTLFNDPDAKFVPSIIEKIILPKLTEHIELCWDPLSTTQTFKLVGLIGKLSRDYPSLRPLSNTLKQLFAAILDKMKLSLENDVFIPIFPKHMQEAKTSFFQRQFCSGLKLFRNFISWQGIISDAVLKEIAILSLLNRYLLSAIRVCTPYDAISKAYIIVNTLPRIWLNSECSGILDSLDMFVIFLKNISNQIDKKDGKNLEILEKIEEILVRLHHRL